MCSLAVSAQLIAHDSLRSRPVSSTCRGLAQRLFRVIVLPFQPPSQALNPSPKNATEGQGVWGGRKRKRESVRECRSSCSSKPILSTCQCCQCKLSSAQQLRDTSTLHQDSSWTTVRTICYVTLVWDSKPLLPGQSWCFYTYSLYTVCTAVFKTLYPHNICYKIIRFQ